MRAKEGAEMRYWRGRVDAEGDLANGHYQAAFCDRYGLDPSFYDGKRILDIGCGPRGGLEWAHMAAERVGLDPLADSYRELGADRHAMTYVATEAEAIPFPDAHFDVVSTHNSLDHVDSVETVVGEIGRVTKQGGTWLLAVETNAAPTATEPHLIEWDFASELEGWQVEDERHLALFDHGMYASWERGVEWADGPGFLAARLTPSPRASGGRR